MTIWAGVGTSASHDPQAAGAAAAREAVGEQREPPALVLVFATAGHDQAALIAGVTSVTGDAPLSGCSGAGVISQRGSDEGSHAVSVLALGGVAARTVRATNVSADARAAARQLAEQLRPFEPDLVLLFPDGLRLDSASFLDELHDALPGVLSAGGLAGEMHRFEQTYQYHDGQVASDSISAVGLRGAFRTEIELSHGCDVVGIEHLVGRTDGPTVLEIDGRPAWSVMREYLDGAGDDLDADSMPYLAVAQPVAEGSDEVVIHVPLRLDKTTGGLFFAGALKTGDRVMMARRDRELICRRAVDVATRMRERNPDRAPAVVLQFDCAGRGNVLFGDRVGAELIEPVQNVLGKDIPWIGFHSYGEIGPIAGRSRYHNYTLALCALYGRDA
jgi:hypothetical protein